MLESVVRPFQSPAALSRLRNAIVVVNSGSAPTPTVFAWGKAGDVPAGAPITGNPLDDIQFNVECCSDKFEQRTRKTETKRIEASDGSGFFVEFQRPTEIVFGKPENECSSAKTPDIVVAPIANLFTPQGQPVYSITDNTAKKNCAATFEYTYDD